MGKKRKRRKEKSYTEDHELIQFPEEKKKKIVPFFLKGDEEEKAPSFLEKTEGAGKEKTVGREADKSGKKPDWMESGCYQDGVQELKTKTLELLYHFKSEGLCGTIRFRRGSDDEKETIKLQETNLSEAYDFLIREVEDSFEKGIERMEMQMGGQTVTITNRAAYCEEKRETERKLADSVKKELPSGYFESGELNVY